MKTCATGGTSGGSRTQQNSVPFLSSNAPPHHRTTAPPHRQDDDLRGGFLGIVALHPPADVVLVQSQLAPVSKSNAKSKAKSKAKPRADLTTDLSFLDKRRSPLTPIGQLYKYRTTGTWFHAPPSVNTERN